MQSSVSCQYKLCDYTTPGAPMYINKQGSLWQLALLVNRLVL